MATILIVDDREINRHFLVALLSYSGNHLLEASDGKEALEIVQKHRPDLIITDILMPTMDGVEFAQRLRADAVIGATPVIFYTATYRVHEAKQLAQTCGVSFVLPKPCEAKMILETVNQALGLPAEDGLQPPPAETSEVAVAPTERLLTEYLTELESCNQTMTTVLERGKVTAVAERNRLCQLSHKLADTTAKLQNASLRLVALTELGQHLATERDPQRVLTTFCHAAHDILTSKCAVLGLLHRDGQQLDTFVARGLTKAEEERLRALPPRQGVLGWLLETNRPIRWCAARESALEWDLSPFDHPPRSFLGVPLATVSGSVGWLFFADRLAAEEFSNDDVCLALTLASQVAIAYENARLYEEARRRNALLEIEIGECQRAEDEMRQLNEQLEQRVHERTTQLEAANQELEAFAYSVSHDLRSPVRHIDGFAQCLTQSEVSVLSAEGKHYLAQITDSARYMGQLIDDLLQFCRLARAKIYPSRVDLSGLVQDVIRQLKPDIKNRAIRWNVDSLTQVEGDRFMLRQVWVNLLSNAIKYTRPRDPAEIEIGSAPETSAEIVCFVRDNGVGFDMAYVDKLFGVFQRLHTDDQFEGTGIGLANVRRIIARHGGRTWAEGQLDAGATFFFSLPKIQPSQ